MTEARGLHVVTGAGPVGSTVALQLAEAGTPVRVVTRSGSGPDHPLVELVRGDASDRAQLRRLLEGAVAVHHCIHGSAYDARTWRAELPGAEQAVMDVAGEVGAVVVFPESLYAYGPVEGVMTEDLPREATTGKLGVRAELLRARAAHPTTTVSVAASDFFGPRVRTAHAGERMVPTVLAGRTVRLIGSLRTPHSFTYVPDLAAAMIRAAAEAVPGDTFLHAPTLPAVTQQQLVEAVARAAEVPVPRTGVVPVRLLRLLGRVLPSLRELAETGYQFDRPFVVDSSASQARLGLEPTPFDDQVAATVAWWRTQQAA